MEQLIEKVDLGFSVVGLPQHGYAVDGVLGDVAAAMRLAELRHVVGVEDLVSATARAVRERTVELDELGEALAIISGAQAYFADKSEDYLYAGADFGKVRRIGLKYGIDVGNSTAYSKNEVSILMERFQERMDAVNNSVNQAMQSVDSYYMKRDQGFTRVSGLQKKALEAAGRAIRNI